MRLLTGSARLAGVIGWPVAHTRSPRIHGAWLARHGIDGAYLPLAASPDDLETVVRGLVKAGFAGVNVTIPHKQAALALCDDITYFARRVGAVNTMVFRDGRIIGDNTDGAGFIANLRAHGVDPAAGPALVLGAGGAARATGAALLDAGAAVVFCNRTMENGDALARRLGGRNLPWQARADALADFALLVNTTSLGMTDQPALPMDLTKASTGLAVCDIVYAPLETRLLADARARNLKAVGGLGMLLHQAVPGFAAWFGVTPLVDAELYQVAAGDLPCS